jgi:hypothetical protein
VNPTYASGEALHQRMSVLYMVREREVSYRTVSSITGW